MIARPHSILLDSEALSAWAAVEQSMHAWAAVARRTDSTLHTSALTLAEVTDGTDRDVNVRRAVKAVRLHAVTEDIGYQAGRLRFAAATRRRKPRDLTVDAVVAATALALPTPVVVLTSDADDLRLLVPDTAIRIEQIGT